LWVVLPHSLHGCTRGQLCRLWPFGSSVPWQLVHLCPGQSKLIALLWVVLPHSLHPLFWLAATLKAGGEGFASAYTEQVAGTLDLNDATPLSPKRFSARTVAHPLAHRKPLHPLQPRAQPPQPATHPIHMHSRRSQPPAHSAAAADARSVPWRFSDVSCGILPRLGASDAAPSSPITFPTRTAAPSARPSQASPSATAPSATASARNTQHQQRIAGVRNHPLTAPAAADARSVPRRLSDVSCVILPILGASDATPPSPI
jgi:hypothetical protein